MGLIFSNQFNIENPVNALKFALVDFVGAESLRTSESDPQLVIVVFQIVLLRLSCYFLSSSEDAELMAMKTAEKPLKVSQIVQGIFNAM